MFKLFNLDFMRCPASWEIPTSPPPDTMELRRVMLFREPGSVTEYLSQNTTPNFDKWDHRFMDLAKHVSTWSKDPSTKVGAVIVGVDRRQIVHGYNGFPPGIEDDGRLHDRQTKYGLIVHAERNAVYNATFPVEGGTMYCTMHPCLDCVKTIVSKKIVRILVPQPPPVEKGRWTEEIPMAQKVLREGGVRVDIYAVKI